MLRIALFIDGFSRATLIPFAPLLLGHLMRMHNHNDTEDDLDDNAKANAAIDVSTPLPSTIWPSVTRATAGMIAIYMLGRALGAALGSHKRVRRYYHSGTASSSSSSSSSSTKAFSRTVGAVLALHLFCFGAGLNEPVSIFFMRFAMGILVGVLLRVASLNVEDHNGVNANANMLGFQERSLEHFVETGIAKVWLTGFAVSILTSGVLYYPLCHSPIFTVITGVGKGAAGNAIGSSYSSWSWILAPLFFVAVVHVSDFILQMCCGRLIKSDLYDYGQVDKHDCMDYDMSPLGKETNVELMHGTSSTLKRRVRLGSGGTGTNRTRLGSQNRSRTYSGTRGRHDSLNRIRLDSSMSNDIFFDCESQCTNNSVTWGFDDEKADAFMHGSAPPSPGRKKDHSFSVAKYENGKCVYDDGSPAHIQAELSAAHPPRAWKYIHKANADQKWEETKRWRMEKKMWKIHCTPHVNFSIIKAAYSHHVHGYSKLGYPVVYEKPGTMTLKKCFADGSISVDGMMHHYSYFLEFLSNNLCTRPEVREVLDRRPENQSQSHWGFMVVMDVSGLSLGILSGDVLRYLQQAGKVNVNHYPNSSTMALLVNSPFWLSGAFGTIKSILPENTQADILSSANQLEGMRKYIDDDQIPKEFGGSSPYALGEHPYEKELEKVVEEGMNGTDDCDDYDEEDLTSRRQDDFEMQPKPAFEMPLHMQTIASEQQLDGFYDMESGRRPLSDSDHQYSNTLSPKSSLSFDDALNSFSISLRHGHKWRNARYYAEEYIFMMISVIHCVWCAAQGSLETLLPVWLLSPQILGGLGYEPRRSAFALFTASIVVMWLSRSKIARSVAYVSNDPLRGYRIGVGAEAVLLTLLPFIPFVSNFDSMLVLTTNAIICASMFIASIIGRMSSVRLHAIASSAYIEKVSLRCDTRTAIGQLLNMIADFVRKGGFSYVLGVTGEMTGALIVTPIVVWSLQEEHHFPIDASFSFYTGAALCASLYMLSFSFKVSGETTGRKVDRSDDRIHPSNSIRCSILRDVIAVSVSDMASMFEENNWSSSSALGRQGPIRRPGEDRKYGVKKV